ncbi:hypothetical protein B0A55_07660 [Friedmanniomyces simplex]|uniref:Uncharacterized protein n=1 Tax=Friedmanniomyces simplex TaxID=329884 RepID=A0A4U0XA11_9PEZI|nr:hypothetical protein B0A55_07660 [Friedmanniomyces simplex]
MRTLIYDHCIADIKQLRIFQNGTILTLPLEQVSHEIRSEVLPMWHAQFPITAAELECDVHNFDIRHLSGFLLQWLPGAARLAFAAGRKVYVTLVLEPVVTAAPGSGSHEVLVDWLRDCPVEGLPSTYYGSVIATLWESIYYLYVTNLEEVRITANGNLVCVPLAQVSRHLRLDVLPMWRAQVPTQSLSGATRIECHVHHFDFVPLSSLLHHLPWDARTAVSATKALRLPLTFEDDFFEESGESLMDWMCGKVAAGRPSCTYRLSRPARPGIRDQT